MLKNRACGGEEPQLTMAGKHLSARKSRKKSLAGAFEVPIG